MIHIDVRGANEIKMFLKSLGNTGMKVVSQELNKIAVDYRNNILKAMRSSPGGGKVYKKKGGVIHIASLPGFPPRVDTGNYWRTILVEKGLGYSRVYITQKNPPYPIYLEEGTSKMKARPVWKPTLERLNWQKRVVNRIIAERFAGRSIMG